MEMAFTTGSSKGQIVIPRTLRDEHRLAAGTRLQVAESDGGWC
jgi:AbrB family looped-hinge helix DNA binding protein